MNTCRMSGLRLNIHRPNIKIIRTQNNNTLHPGGYFIFQGKRRGLVAEEAKLYVIIVGNLDTFTGTA